MSDVLGFCLTAAGLFLAFAAVAVLADVLAALGWLGDDEAGQ